MSFTEEELAQKELGSKRVDPLHLGPIDLSLFQFEP